jgi:hypothetical protein
MRFSFISMAIVATASALIPKSFGDDMIYTDHDTAYSFSVTSTEEPVETNNDDEFINQCLVSSYNSIHNPSKYLIDSVTQESEQILPSSLFISDHDKFGTLLLRRFLKSWQPSRKLLSITNLPRAECDLGCDIISTSLKLLHN